jgi:DNA invertase Pin-like site-specific DNA recombinase
MELLDTVRKGDVVIVWKPDRLARSLRQLIDTRVMLNEHGVEFHSLIENIDSTTPSGKLTFQMFAALAEFERDILRQRVNAGLKAARRRGRVGGRAKALDEADLKKAPTLLRSGTRRGLEPRRFRFHQPLHCATDRAEVEGPQGFSDVGCQSSILFPSRS